MALEFPANPADGDVYPAAPNSEYIYNDAKGAWLSLPTEAAKTITSDIAPVNAKDGDQWFNSIDGCLYLYYVDVDGGQWLQTKNDASFTSTLGPRVDAMEANDNRNYIINGAFDIWQRGTSFSGNVYTADRWYTGNNPSAAARSTDVPAGFTYSIDVTGSNHLLGHRIESLNSISLSGTTTVSFYAKSLSGTNSMAVAIGTPSATDNFAISNIEYTSSAIAISSSWARYTVTFNALSSGAARGAFIYIYRNGSTSTDRTLITGVQLQAGAVATAFHRNAPSLQAELAACQRYYAQIGPFPGVAAYVGFCTLQAANTTVLAGLMPLPVPMRVPPTSLSWTGTIGNYNIYTGNGGITGTLSLASDRTTNVGAWLNATGSGFTATSFYYLNAVNNNAAYLGFSAEL